LAGSRTTPAGARSANITDAIRYQSGVVLRGDDFYLHVTAGALLSEDMNDDPSHKWWRARIDSFELALAPELAQAG
jgi:hypothetical protein